MKLTSQELRIGNWVEINGSYGQVQAIDEYNNIKLFGYYPLCEIKLIPLAEEILLKCGAVKAIDEWFVNDKCFQFFDNGFCYSAGLGYQLSLPIKYLHQLQNLYFALTGQELNVKF